MSLDRAAEETVVQRALAQGYLTPETLARVQAQRTPGAPLLAALATCLPAECLPELRDLYNDVLQGRVPTQPAASIPSTPVGSPVIEPTDAATKADDAPKGVLLPRVLVGVASALVSGLLVSVLWYSLSETTKPAPRPAASTESKAGADPTPILASPANAPLPEPRALIERLAAANALDRDALRAQLSGGGRAQLNAAVVLARLGDEGARPGLEELEGSEDPLAALVGADGLARLDGAPPVTRLLEAAEHERRDVRLYALSSLASVELHEVADALVKLAREHDDPQTRAAAARGALAIDPEALKRLRPDPVVAHARPTSNTEEIPDGAFVAEQPEPASAEPEPVASAEPVARPAAKPVAKPAAKPAPKTPKGPAPNIAAAHRAKILLAEGRADQARDLLAKELPRFPEDAALHRLHGRALLDAGDAEAAQTSLRKAIDLEPDLHVAYFDLAAAFGARGQKRNALGALGMALRLGFRDVVALRADPHLEAVKGSKPFRELMARFFNSSQAAESDAEARLKHSQKQLRAVFKQEKDAYVRALEVVRFPEAGTPEATEFLFGLLKDKQPIVRRAVAERLGEVRDAKAQAFLCEQAAGRLPARQKIGLLRALGELPTDEAFLPLLMALEDKNRELRLTAVRSIGNHPDARAVEPLIELLSSEKPRDAVVVTEALGKITGQDLGPVADDWRNWWASHKDHPIGPVRNPCQEEKRLTTVAVAAGLSDRTGKSKARALKKNGGSKSTEASVRAALAWLARHQSDDGRWDTDQWARGCDEKEAWERVTKVRKRRWDVRLTGLVLMAFLGAGHTHQDGEYARVVRRGLGFLERSQRKDGYFAGDHRPHLFSHATATIAVAEAYGMTRDCRLRAVAERALGYVVRRQHTTGGWGWTHEESHTTVSGWFAVTLLTAEEAGLDVPASALVQFRRFLDQVTVSERTAKAGFAYGVLRPGTQVGEGVSVLDHEDVREGGNALSTTVSLWGRLLTGQTPGDPRVRGGLAQLGKRIPGVGGKDKQGVAPSELVFFGTQAALLSGGKLWSSWNPAMQRALLVGQVKDSCERGTWEPANAYGRIYTTALAALTLESYYR